MVWNRSRHGRANGELKLTGNNGFGFMLNWQFVNKE